MKSTGIKLFSALVAVALSTATALAANVAKNSSGTDLTAAASWAGGTGPAPAAADVAVWDTGSLGAGLTLNAGTPSWLGLKVNAGASSAISIGSGGTLTLGVSGIDMSASTINATLGCDLSLANGYQSWLVASGKTLAINGTVTRNTGAAVNFSTIGTTTSSTLANDATGILGGWATTGNGGGAHAIADFAANNGSGSIITYAGYTAISAGAASSQTLGAGTVTQNWKTSNANSGSDGNGYATTLNNGGTINSLVVQGDVIVPAGTTLTNGSGGLILSGISRWIKGPNGNSGDTAQLTSGLASGELFVDVAENDSSASNWRIWTKIVNNGGTAVSVVKYGPGLVELANTNTYTGNTYLNAGSINLGTSAALGAGTLYMNGGTLANGGASAQVYLTNNIVLSGNNAIQCANNGGAQNFQFNNTISGSGSLTVGNDGNNISMYLIITNTMTSGTITMANWANVVRMDTPLFGNANVAWVFNNTTSGKDTLEFNGGTISFGSLTGNGYITGNAGASTTQTISVGNLNLNDAFSGIINQNSSDVISLTKVGTGALTLSSGSSTYSGVTTVENGSLVAGNTVSVSANGPFGNTSSAIALGDATSISGNLSPSLFTGGAFTMARTVTVGSANTATTGIYTLGGNTANSSTFSGAITLNQNLAVTQVASGTLNLTAGITSGASGTQTVTVNNPGAVTVSTTAIGGGTGTIALTKTGTNTLTLSAANTYTGNTTVSNGTVLVTGSLASGSAVSVTGSGSILGGSGTISGATTISSSGALTPRPNAGSATTITFGGNLTIASASANFTVSTSVAGANDKVNYGSSSTLTLDSSDTINITGTTFDVVNDYTLFTSTGGTVSMATTPTLKINGVTSDQTSTGSYQLLISGSSVKLHYITTATPPTVNSASASPTSLGHYQTTAITVNVTPVAGKTIISVTVGVDGLGGAGDPVTLTGPGGDGTGNWTGTFTAAASLAAGSYTISGTVNQSDTGAAAWSVSGITVTNASPVWSGLGGDNKWSTGGNWVSGSGPGLGDIVAFAGSTQPINNMDSSVSIAALTFNSGAGSFDITNAANTLTLTGGLTNNSTSAQTLDVPVALSGAQTINAAAGNIAISGAVSGSGAALTKAGNATLALSGVNTYSGATTIGGGALSIGGAGQLGGGTYSAVITNNGSLNYNSSAAQTLSGVISGAGSLTNSGSSTMTLSGANTFSGGATINSGTAKFSNASAFGIGAVTLNGGTLQAGGGYTLANNFTVSGATVLDTAGNNTALSGNFSGSAALTLNNSGFASTLTLSGNNSGYSGTFTANFGAFGQAVDFTSATAGSAGAAWVFSDNNGDRVRIHIGTGTLNFGSLAGSGQLQNDTSGTASIISVGALNTSTLFSGTIKDNGTGTLALTKVGSGALTLSGGNTYTGNTTINAGELIGQTGGSCANSAVTVAAGATNGVKVAAANGQWTCASLTYISGATYADFDFGSVVPSITTAPLNLTGNLTTNGMVQVIVRNGTGFTAGTVYPLVTWAGTGPGSLSAFAKPIGTVGTLQLSGKTISLNAGIYVPNVTFTNTPGIARIITVSDLVTAGLASSQGSPNYTITVGTPVNGGAAFTNTAGTMMAYTNSTSFAPASDSFNYTVSDGVSSATATVSLSFASVAGPTISNPGLVGGNPQFTFHGIPGYSYHIQRSPDMTTWTTLQPGVTLSNSDGSYTYTDTSGSVPSPSVFYRVSYP